VCLTVLRWSPYCLIYLCHTCCCLSQSAYKLYVVIFSIINIRVWFIYFKKGYTFTFPFLLNLSTITKRKRLVLHISIKFLLYFAVVIVHANCVLNSTLLPVEEVRFNYYHSTNFLPYLSVMHDEYYLRQGRWPIWLYTYLRNCLAKYIFDGWGYSLFSIEYVLLQLFTTMSTTFLSFQGKILVDIIVKYLDLRLSSVILRPVTNNIELLDKFR